MTFKHFQPADLLAHQVVRRMAMAMALLASTVPAAAQPEPAQQRIRAAIVAIDGAAIRANEARTESWPSHGLDYAETRHSRLRQIDRGNVGRLGLAWSHDLEATRGIEATPLVAGGVMFVTASWSVVHAIDARSGRRLWSYDPQVPRSYGIRACCDVVNRGVALWKGKVFVGSLDGRLIALDAASGGKVWEVDTVVDRRRAYTITGAPRVVKGKVIIGNGGAEYGVRGYVTAYDAETGRQAWRWFTVPGDPALPFEDESMRRAAATWDPAGRWWEIGGGGTVWDSMAFDPELNLLYIGTGNGSPWSRKRRSPAGGDNLYLSSIVALDPDTGRYVWHYQETLGDNWDYTATQQITLAELSIDGRRRKVLLHAPKNGFFFVIDRSDGRFISAQNFVDVNWASGYGADGRPIETAQARPEQPGEAIPGPTGAHNWHSMSFNPDTGLVYIPAQTRASVLGDDKDWRRDQALPGRIGSGAGWNLGVLAGSSRTPSFGRLIAWDPVAQKEAWRHEHRSFYNGGTLSTAGGLVFQGTADGRFIAFDARSGAVLWQSPVGLGIVAAPITYELDGRQYVAIAAGWGGALGLTGGVAPKTGSGTVFTFALDGKAALPAFADAVTGPLLQGVPYDPALVGAGAGLYVAHCVQCHGVPGADKGGSLPNLGRSAKEVIEHLDRFVFNGPGVARGMPDFSGRLQPEDVDKLKAFIQGTADRLRAAAAASAASAAAPAAPQPNPYLARSPNNQTHWNDAATDSTETTVPRGRYELTPEAVQMLPNESVSLPSVSDRVAGQDIHWWWAGYSLRKVRVDGGKLVEVARTAVPVRLPDYRPVDDAQRQAQADQVQRLLAARDERALVDYMKSQPNRMLSASGDQVANGSVYALLTRDDAFIGCNGRQIFRIDQEDPANPASAMRPARIATLPSALFDNERVRRGGARLPSDLLFGLGMSFNGYLVANTAGGKVISLRRDTLEVVDVFSTPGADELFLNSFATGPEANGGAVYVASNTTMYRLVVTADGKIRSDEASGAWAAPYDRGIIVGAPKIGDGTGATPTLMGFGPDDDRLVVITDGARKMRLVAFWRDAMPAGWTPRPGAPSARIADQREVDMGAGLSTVQSEQSVAAWGDYAFVVNNIPAQQAPFAAEAGYYVAMINGATRPGPVGVATLKWDRTAHRWQPLWSRTDVSSISIVPMISGGGRMAIVDGYFAERWNDRHHIGMDLDSGKTVLSIRTGTDPRFNGMFAPIKVDGEGNLFYGMAFGLVRVQVSKLKRLPD
jgi:quinohemoprotein ethanol dehydrogenase